MGWKLPIPTTPNVHTRPGALRTLLITVSMYTKCPSKFQNPARDFTNEMLVLFGQHPTLMFLHVKKKTKTHQMSNYQQKYPVSQENFSMVKL